MIMDNCTRQEANVEVVRRLLEEGFGLGRMIVLPVLIAPDYINHLTIGDHYGPEGVRINISAYRTMIPDLSVTLDDAFAVDDRVARRFTFRGTAHGTFADGQADGASVELRGVAIDRLRDGQLVETWARIDCLPNGL